MSTAISAATPHGVAWLVYSDLGYLGYLGYFGYFGYLGYLGDLGYLGYLGDLGFRVFKGPLGVQTSNLKARASLWPATELGVAKAYVILTQKG